MECRAPEVLIAGSAGTGKTRSCLEKLHALCTELPDLRCLIVRKSRESLTESALVTFEDKVLAGWPGREALLGEGGQRRMRQAYKYPNGSVIVIGGMDKPSKTLSTEYDFVYVQEAIELTEHDWEMLTRPLRNGKAPYQQILADTNPDAPTHWLKRRCDAGKTLLLESRHEDNPALWDGHDWTPEGKRYIARLDALTGPRKPRLRYGRWVQAEDVVYEGWDAAIHVIDRFPIPNHWPRWWSVDFGYVNPFVWQLWAVDGDGRLYLVREIYHTHRLVEDHAKDILCLAGAEIPAKMAAELGERLGDWTPRAIICDHDAEGRATLERHLGMRTTPANKDIAFGIQAVAGRLRVQGDGKPRLFILRDSLAERDPWLVENKLPTCAIEEFDAYVWKKAVTIATHNQPDVPADKDNHACDSMRYLCAALERGISALPDPALLEGKPEWKMEGDNRFFGRRKEDAFDEEPQSRWK